MAELLGLIVGGLSLAGGGVAFGYWLAVGGRERSKAEAIQAEFDAYREQVGAHFEQTAQHFQTIGREYRALYDHMASGAEQLCDTRSAEERLSFDPRPGPTPASNENRRNEASDGDQPSESPPVASDKAGDDGEDSAPVGADVLAASEAASDSTERADDSEQSDDESTPESRARASGGECCQRRQPGKRGG